MKTLQFAFTLVCCLLVVGLSAQTKSTTCAPAKEVSTCKAKATSAVAISLTAKADCKPGDPACEPCPPGCCKIMAAKAGQEAPLVQTVALAANATQAAAATPQCQPLKCKPADCKPSANKTKKKALVTAKL